MKQKKKDKQKSNMLRKVRTKRGKMKRGKMAKGKMERGKMEKGKMAGTSRSPLRSVGNKRKLSTLPENDVRRTKRKSVLDNEPFETLDNMTLDNMTLDNMTLDNMTHDNETHDNETHDNENYYGRDTTLSGQKTSSLSRKKVPWQAETKLSTHHALTVKMEHSKKRLDTIKLPSYVMKSKGYYNSVEDYIVDHYSFLRASPGKSPIVDAYDKVNGCYVDIKVTTKHSAGRSVLTSSGQLKYLKDKNHNRGYYLLVRNTGGRKDIFDVELLFAAPEDEKYVEDKTYQYVNNLKKIISNSK
jgi:hypothetical protein